MSGRVTILDPAGLSGSEEGWTYSLLDPEGKLLAEDVVIFLIDGLKERVEALSRQRGAEPPEDFVGHAGRSRRRLYLDRAAAGELMARQTDGWRARWAARQAQRFLHPAWDEARLTREGFGVPSREDGAFDNAPIRAPPSARDVKPFEETPELDSHGTDLTEKARRGEIDPVVGREDEIDRLIVILSRRRKNNPMLIGEPGVGKTALAEGTSAS
jgi:hypothetical protein